MNTANQSYAVAEAVRFALLPSSNFNAADPANAQAFQALTANIGAATAYAMHYASQKAGESSGGLASTKAPAPPPAVGGPIMRGVPDPPVAVQPSANDVFYAVAAGALGAVASSCDATWACHTSGCLNTTDPPEKLLQRRADGCCYLVGPLLRGIERQLTLFGASGTKMNPDIRNDAPVGCNAGTANYMGDIVRMDVNSQTPGAPVDYDVVATAADCCAACVADMQCNVWVFCSKAWGFAGCDWQALNYNASLVPMICSALVPTDPDAPSQMGFSPWAHVL
ncbi:g9442 [Coccomyxa elongata]